MSIEGGRSNPIKVPRDVSDGRLHQLGCIGNITQGHASLQTAVAPDLVGGLTHIPPDRHTFIIEIAVPPQWAGFTKSSHITVHWKVFAIRPNQNRATRLGI